MTPGTSGKSHRLKPRSKRPITKSLPLNFLLGSPQNALGDFELARLAEVADLRSELHAILDRLIDAMSQAALASWFKAQDRQTLKHAIENEESPIEMAQRMIWEGQRSEEERELFPLPSLPPGAAHLAAAMRYQERNIAEGKCSVCPKPLAHNSVRYCEKHLRARLRHKPIGTKGEEPGSVGYLYCDGGFESRHGRQPGTLASLEMNREKKTRALLAELGIAPESAAVSLKAAKEALIKCMPETEAKAASVDELMQAAQIPTRTTAQQALRELVVAGTIQRIVGAGMGVPSGTSQATRTSYSGRS
jgi:hypothetical protein